MDTTLPTVNDFFKFANGTWMKNNPIPAKETRWGSFNELHEFNSQAVKSLLEKAEKNKDAKEGSIEKRVGDFYASAMDSLAIEKAGDNPVAEDMERINKITDLQGVMNEVLLQQSTGTAIPLFNFYVGQDRKNVEKNMPQLGQGGISLPDRD